MVEFNFFEEFKLEMSFSIEKDRIIAKQRILNGKNEEIEYKDDVGIYVSGVNYLDNIESVHIFFIKIKSIEILELLGEYIKLIINNKEEEIIKKIDSVLGIRKDYLEFLKVKKDKISTALYKLITYNIIDYYVIMCFLKSKDEDKYLIPILDEENYNKMTDYLKNQTNIENING